MKQLTRSMQRAVSTGAFIWAMLPAALTHADPVTEAPARDEAARVLWLAQSLKSSQPVIDKLASLMPNDGVDFAAVADQPTHKAASERARRAGAIGAFWVRVAPDKLAHLYFASAGGKLYLVRRIDWTLDRPAELGELLAVIVRASLQALSSGRAIGVEVTEPTASEPIARDSAAEAPPATEASSAVVPAPTDTKPSATLRFAGFAGYGARIVDSEPTVRRAIVLGVRVERSRWAAELQYRPSSSEEFASDTNRLIVSHQEVSLAGEWVLRTAAVRFGVGVAATADYTRLKDIALSDSLIATTERSRTQFSVQPYVAAAVTVGAGMSLFVQAGPTIHPRPIRYVVGMMGQTQTIAEPWAVQPQVVFGLAAQINTESGPF